MIPILSMTTSYGQGDSPVFCFVPFILGVEIFGPGESTGSQLLAGLHFLPGSGDGRDGREGKDEKDRCHMKPVVLISLIFRPIQVLGSFKAIFCLALFVTGGTQVLAAARSQNCAQLWDVVGDLKRKRGLVA